MIPLGRRWKSNSLPSTTTVWPALLPPCWKKFERPLVLPRINSVENFYLFWIATNDFAQRFLNWNWWTHLASITCHLGLFRDFLSYDMSASRLRQPCLYNKQYRWIDIDYDCEASQRENRTTLCQFIENMENFSDESWARTDKTWAWDRPFDAISINHRQLQSRELPQPKDSAASLKRINRNF